jgi:hypothetical protein
MLSLRHANPVARLNGSASEASLDNMSPNKLVVTMTVGALQFDFGPDRCVFKLTDAAGEYSVTCGRGEWVESHTDVPGRDLHHGYALRPARVVAGAHWH